MDGKGRRPNNDLDSRIGSRWGRWALGAAAALLAGCAGPAQHAGLGAFDRSYSERIPGTTVSFDMVWIEDGGFWIGKTEVTWDEYLAYCAFDDEPPEGRDAVSRPSKPLEVAPADRGWGLGRRPAISMSWNGAKTYCKWLSLKTGRVYTLPTEEQWALACGEAESPALAEQAWTAADSNFRTQEVGQKLPNGNGVHDMLGNVWEYAAGPFHATQPSRAVLRGGSWKEDPDAVSPESRLGFDKSWVMNDPNFPPGVWWVPDGSHLGMRVLRVPDDEEE